MEFKTLAGIDKKEKKKKAPDNSNTDTPTQMETTIQNRDRERQDGSLSSGAARHCQAVLTGETF